MNGLPRRHRDASRALCFLLAAAACLAASAAFAAPVEKRPKICLVLSGGGARGAAHIGVIKVLEEMRVPIDCIAGTSMGSIVGGSYATGLPIQEMEKTLSHLSTDLLFKEKPPRQDRSIRLKQDDLTILSALELGLRDGQILLRKGLVSGVQLETVLRELSKVSGYQDFDQLPIPFRAVATDLKTGKPVVLREGEIFAAMRASMSVPAVIEPARLNGRMLVDGGLTNNLPVDVARAMGADIVIAVNLGTPLMDPEKVNSLLAVTAQMVSILTEQNVQASLASLGPQDILIEPGLGDFSSSDFDHMPTTVPIGEAAARAVADRLSRLSLSESKYAAFRAGQRVVAAAPPLAPVDEIRFDAMKHVNPEVAAARMETKPNAPIDRALLDQDMRRLYGSGDFEHVSYRLIDEPGRRVLGVDAAEKSWGPDYLRLGLGLSSDFRGASYFNVLASYRKTWLNRLGGEWRTDLQIGHETRFFTEFYQPLDVEQRFFVVPSFEIGRTVVDIYQADQRVGSYDLLSDRTAIELGSQVGKYAEVRLGLDQWRVRPKLDTGPAVFETTERQTYRGVSFRAVVDQLDSANFPRAGYAGSLKVFGASEDLGSDANFTRAQLDGSVVKSFGEHTFSVGYKAAGRLDDNALPSTALFQWGGFLKQSGYATDSLIGESITFGRLVYYKRLARWTYLEGVLGGMSLELGRVGRPLVADSASGKLRSASLFLGVDTPLGPLYIAYGRAEGGYSAGYLFLGRP